MVSMPSLNERALVEVLADYAHVAWSGWMNYLFSVSKAPGDGTFVIPKEKVDRWLRQVATPYPELPEDEKKSDRDEALQILHRIGVFIRGMVNAEREANRDCLIARRAREYVEARKAFLAHDRQCSDAMRLSCWECHALERMYDEALTRMEEAVGKAGGRE